MAEFCNIQNNQQDVDAAIYEVVDSSTSPEQIVVDYVGESKCDVVSGLDKNDEGINNDSNSQTDDSIEDYATSQSITEFCNPQNDDDRNVDTAIYHDIDDRTSPQDHNPPTTEYSGVDKFNFSSDFDPSYLYAEINK